MTYLMYKVNKLSKEDSKKDENKGKIFKQEEKIENILSINWEDDKTKTFLSFDFESTTELECGQWVELYESSTRKTVFYGLIVLTEQTGVNSYRYEGYDYGFYLEKNSITIQFEEDQSLTDAIKAVCKRADLSVGSIPDITTKVKGIYKNQTISKILFDIYKNTFDDDFSDKYYFDCTNGKVNIFSYIEQSQFTGVINDQYKVNSFEYILTYNKKTSMNDLKNKVEVWQSVKDKDSIGTKLDECIDKNSAEKYGLLIHTEETKLQNLKELEEFSYKTLNELNKLLTTITFTVRADHRLRIGVKTHIESNALKIDGLYDVIKSKHIIKGSSEKVEITALLHQIKDK